MSEIVCSLCVWHLALTPCPLPRLWERGSRLASSRYFYFGLKPETLTGRRFYRPGGGARSRDRLRFGRLTHQIFHFPQIGPFHRLAIHRAQRRFARLTPVEYAQFNRNIIGGEAVCRERFLAVAAKAQAAVRLFVRDAVLLQPETYFLRKVSGEMDLNRAGRGDGPAQYRSHQTRIELGQKAHGLGGEFAQPAYTLGETSSMKQPQVFLQRGIHLVIARQMLGLGQPQARRRLALGGLEIAHALLRHDARGICRDVLAQLI